MSETVETSTQSESGQDSGAVSDVVNSVPDNISLGDYDPDGPIGAGASDAFADLFDGATDVSSILPNDDKSEGQVQEEESGELPVSDDAEETDEPEGDSDDDSDIETADDDIDEEVGTATTNPELFHIDDLKEENVSIEMKVDGEVRTYTANEIQKILGAEAVATRKSKTASQDIEKAQAMLNDAESRMATAQQATELAQGNEELALFKAQYAEIATKLEDPDVDAYEFKELTQRQNQIASAHNAKLNEVNQKKADVDAQRVSAVRARLEGSDRGKKFLTEGSAVESFNKHLSDAGVTQVEFEAIKHSPAILDILLEHQELKASTKPVQRKKKSVTKTLRKSASQSTPVKSNKSSGKGQTFSERMKTGDSVSIQEMSEGKVTLDFDL